MRCRKRLRKQFWKKLKNAVIRWTLCIALIAAIASIGSVEDPDFTWDKLPVRLIIAGAALTYILLVGYANAERQQDEQEA